MKLSYSGSDLWSLTVQYWPFRLAAALQGVRPRSFTSPSAWSFLTRDGEDWTCDTLHAKQRFHCWAAAPLRIAPASLFTPLAGAGFSVRSGAIAKGFAITLLQQYYTTAGPTHWNQTTEHCVIIGPLAEKAVLSRQNCTRGENGWLVLLNDVALWSCFIIGRSVSNIFPAAGV